MSRARSESSTLSTLYFTVLLCCAVGVEATCVSVENPPPEAVCRVRGNLVDYYPARLYENPSIRDNWKECMSLCFGRAASFFGGSCPAFYFNSTSSLCHFSKKFNLDDIVQDDLSDTVFYNRDCFDCTAEKCPPPKGPNGHGNEIDNGGFENSDYIGPWNGDHYFYPYKTFHPTEPGINSPQGFQCNQKHSIEQSYRSCPGQTHRIDFEAANSKSAAQVRPDIAFSDRSFFNATGHGGSLSWTPAQGETGKKPRNESFFYNAKSHYGIVTIDCSNYYDPGGAALQVDNFQIRPVDLSRLKVLGEKVINGDFEAGKIEPTDIKAPSKKQVSIVSPGLKGPKSAARSKFALQVSGIDSHSRIFLVPKINTTALRKGRRLYRLGLDADNPKALLVSRTGLIFHDRGSPRETEVFGIAEDFAYFYAHRDDFPLWIDMMSTDSDNSTLIIDNISVREIQEE